MGEGWCGSVNKEVWMRASAVAMAEVLCQQQFGCLGDVDLGNTARIPSIVRLIVVQ